MKNSDAAGRGSAQASDEERGELGGLLDSPCSRNALIFSVHKMCSPMMLQGATSTARHRRLGALAHRYSARRRLASSSTRLERRNQFLTPGFQPTAIAGDNCGFYSGSTFYEGAPPGPLPSLHLAAVL